ncbi:MAG: putative head morphosis protein, partial [Phenylobacterium sp.]|nr:putative head morphosis protein [Phenylobacterium sp.]
ERYSRWSFDLRPKGDPSFVQARKVERYYGAQLRKIARHIGELVSGSPPADLMQAALLGDRLRKYSALISPWAKSVAERMIADVSRRDRDAWRARSAEMGSLLRREIETAPTGAVMRESLARQVSLITSLPTEAAERVHHLTLEGIANGTRAKEIAAEIMRTGEVTKSRATLIARTEVGRTATELTAARALHVGSTEFIWRTSGDSDVRPSHRRLNGKAFRWDDPPECDPGHRALPGAIWNCRCYAEPIIPEI